MPLAPGIEFVKHRDLLMQHDQDDFDSLCRQTLHDTYDASKAMLATYSDTRSCYARFGPNSLGQWPNKITELDLDQCHASTEHLTFEAATDARLCDLHQQLKDKPWLICWGGGIDSTAIVASILKNFCKADLDNVVIFCNLDSVWLSPRFYYRYIKPNFRVIDSSHYDLEPLLKHHYVIDGDLADYFWPSRFAYQLGEYANQRWQHGGHHVMAWLVHRLSDATLARKFYNAVKQNLDSVDFTVTTNAEWFWWVNYNFKYTDGFMRKYYRHNTVPFSQITQSHVNWYHCREYNDWAMKHAGRLNHKISPNAHKAEARQYIKDIVDQHDLDRMTKFAAGIKVPLRQLPSNWIALDNQRRYVKDVREILLA